MATGALTPLPIFSTPGIAAIGVVGKVTFIEGSEEVPASVEVFDCPFDCVPDFGGAGVCAPAMMLSETRDASRRTNKVGPLFAGWKLVHIVLPCRSEWLYRESHDCQFTTGGSPLMVLAQTRSLRNIAMDGWATCLPSESNPSHRDETATNGEQTRSFGDD